MKNFYLAKVYALIALIGIGFVLPIDTNAQGMNGIKLGVLPTCTDNDVQEGFPKICVMRLNPQEIDDVKNWEFKDAIDYRINEDSLFVAAKINKDDLSFYDRPAFSGEFSIYLEPVDSGLFAIKVRLRNLNKANLELMLINFQEEHPKRISVLGSNMPKLLHGEKWPDTLKRIEHSGAEFEEISFHATPHLAPKMIGVIRGRQCKNSIINCHIIYLADGESLAFLTVNSLMRGSNIDYFVFVGIPNPNENRVGELLHGRDPTSFNAFMNFVTTEVRNKIEKNEAPKTRLVAGYSNGGAWALDALISHADKFSGAIIMSPAIWKQKEMINLHGKLVFLGAGELERNFIGRTREIETLMSKWEADVKTHYSISGHSMNTWLPIWTLALDTLNSNVNLNALK